MLIKTDFRAGENNEEILPENGTGLPYRCLLTDLGNFVNGDFPWHWHAEIEIDYIAEGEVFLRTGEEMALLQKGEAIFINSGVMHAFRAVPGKECQVYAHLFDMHYLSGAPGSLLEQKYLIPVIRSQSLQTFPICPDSERNIRMIADLNKMAELIREEPFGYEFTIRSALSALWCTLFRQTEEIRARTVVRNRQDDERIKAMVGFIHEHYREHISLEDIAKAANISGRECSRCFKRCISDSPFGYLNRYRVQMAARMLLQSKDSIMTIGENCGFSSNSYFGKVFHDMIGCTPSEYRNGKGRGGAV